LVIETQYYGSPEDKNENNPKQMVEYFNSLNPHTRNEPIKVRSYQLEALYKALKYKRRTILSPTGSGKSLIIYLLSRFIAEEDKRILIVCPTTQLVEQMYKDFGDYSSEIEWDKECHRIYSGYEKQTAKKIVISTWQSLMRLPETWFKTFSCVMIDEVHGAKSTQLQNILEKCTNCEYRYGLTGSLDNSLTHQTMIKGMIGPIIRVAKTRDLIDEGHLSEVKIKNIILSYSRNDWITKQKFNSWFHTKNETNLLQIWRHLCREIRWFCIL
jgi:superfamily II DNA or RNA helicase